MSQQELQQMDDAPLNDLEDAVIGEEEIEVSFKHEKRFNENAPTVTQESEGCNSRNILRSKRQSSKLWNLFTIVSRKHGYATCNFCKMTLSYKGSTSNLKKHVLRKHPKCIDNYSLASNINAAGDTVISEEEMEVSFKHEQRLNKLKDFSTKSQVSNDCNLRNMLKSDKQSSQLWNSFTIVSRKHNYATCNFCNVTLSYKGTTSNLKKHLLRKHPKCVDMTMNFMTTKPNSKSPAPKKPKLSELAGIDSFIINVVANNETDNEVEIVGQEVEPSEIHELGGNCSGEDETPHSEQFTPKIASVSGAENNTASQTKPSSLPSRTHKINDRIEKMKNHRILDLQLECLELKKYSMQMEALLLEQQLNLPRSIHTENLRGCNNVTRGTQTDVGGGNTKVFYITDQHGSSKERTQHLFSFQATTD